MSLKASVRSLNAWRLNLTACSLNLKAVRLNAWIFNSLACMLNYPPGLLSREV